MAKPVFTGSGLFFLHKSPKREMSCRRFRKFPFRTPFCKGKLRISMQPYVSACRWGEKCIFMSIRLLISEWSLQLFHLYVFDNSRFVELNCNTNMISHIDFRRYSAKCAQILDTGVSPCKAKGSQNLWKPCNYCGCGDRTRSCSKSGIFKA